MNCWNWNRINSEFYWFCIFIPQPSKFNRTIVKFQKYIMAIWMFGSRIYYSPTIAFSRPDLSSIIFFFTESMTLWFLAHIQTMFLTVFACFNRVKISFSRLFHLLPTPRFRSIPLSLCRHIYLLRGFYPWASRVMAVFRMRWDRTIWPNAKRSFILLITASQAGVASC